MALQPLVTSLNTYLSDPATPWNISPSLFQRLSSNGSYKKCEVTPQDPEWNFVHQYFNQHPPTNRVISHIYCIHNPSQTNAFKEEIRSMEKEASNPTFSPAWNKEDNALLRQKVIDRWNNATAPYTPFSISFNDQTKESFSKTRILPLWHGSDVQKCNSICSSGFAIFGKHAYLKGGGVDTASTDIGFFGSGVYFTNSARYSADIYSTSGHMLLTWVSMREPFPVIADKAHPHKPSDMKKLEGVGGYKNYNAHYIPVISINPSDKMCSVYYPCTSTQTPTWDEIVVFQKSQTLPRFWVELAVNLPASIPLAPLPVNVSNISSVIPASSALPSIAFGKAEWAKYFGDVGIEPPLPPDIHTILQSPCPFWPNKKVQDTHILVLVPRTMNGKPLTLQYLNQLIQKPLQGTSAQYLNLIIGEYNDISTAKSHWVLLTRDVIQGNSNKSYSEQQALVQAQKYYEVPNVLDATVAILMEYARTGIRLYNDQPRRYTRCQEKYNKDHHLLIGVF